MFNIEIEQPAVDVVAAAVDYMIFESMCIDINQIVTHIEDQGSFARAFYELLKVDAQKTVVIEIAIYAMMLIISLNGIKAKRDNANQSFNLDMPPVLPGVLVKLHHGTFIQKVLDLYHEHLAKFWSPQNIDQIEVDHCTQLKVYNTNSVLRTAINNHGVVTMFNDAWGYAMGRYECLHFFYDGLAIVFANTTLVESNFSILKWEMDANRMALMHLLLEGIFQAKQRAMLQSLML